MNLTVKQLALIAVLSALISGVLIGLVGIPIQKRLNKALYILK